MAVLHGWMALEGKHPGGADEAACSEATAHAARFALEGFVHFVEGGSIGFLLAQDMGLPGFRRGKQFYQPAERLPKWRVRLRGAD